MQRFIGPLKNKYKQMKVLIDVGHPSFVHLFKNSAKQLMMHGHDVLFTARDKDVTYQLLKAYHLPFVPQGRVHHSLLGKLIGLVKFDVRLLLVFFRFRPDLVLSGASPYAAHVAWVRRIPHLLFDDTENKEQLMLFKWCSPILVTPRAFNSCGFKKHLVYSGYHELAYLHPKQFVVEKGELVRENRVLFLLRFVSHKASHDVFLTGLSDVQKQYLVSSLLPWGDVLISSEIELPVSLKAYDLACKPEQIHSVIAKASVLIGDSATMAAEAAVLGVPSLFFDPNGRSYTRELQEKYGLVYNYGTHDEDVTSGLNQVKSILKEGDGVYKKKQSVLLMENVDLTEVITFMAENVEEIATIEQYALDNKLKDFIYD